MSNAQLHYNINSRGYVKGTQIIKTVAAAATPEVLTADGTIFASHLEIWGKNAARNDNTGDVYIQWTSGNGDGVTKVYSGAERHLTAQDGGKFKLSEIYIDVDTNADGVVVVYW